MFERELTDSLFIQRWSIVRTLMPQSIAEHTFLVAHYANDIAVYLGLKPEVHLALLQYALWHDAQDEIFTGDLPGPNKRGLLDAIGPEAKGRWDQKLTEWADRTFKGRRARAGGNTDNPAYSPVVKLIVKTADWLEAAVRMATETQMGNGCAKRHVEPNMNGAIETAAQLVRLHFHEDFSSDWVPVEPLTPGELAFQGLENAIRQCVALAQCGQSSGPWITKEDESRTYHDPCVDS